MDEEWTFAEDSNPEEEPELTFADEDFSFKEVEPELTFAAEPAADGEPPSFRMDFADDEPPATRINDPLLLAAADGALDVVRELVDLGAGPDPQNLCVFFAAQSGNTALVRFLLETFHLSPGILDPDGNTLLHHAAESGSAELVAFLLEAGLDPRAQGAARLTALERAAWQGDLEIVRLLVEAGADVNSEGGRWSAPLAEARKPLCEAVFLYGPPLYAAASRGHLPVVRYLVSQGADPNGRDCNGRTVLHAASRAETPDCMQFLLGLGAE